MFSPLPPRRNGISAACLALTALLIGCAKPPAPPPAPALELVLEVPNAEDVKAAVPILAKRLESLGPKGAVVEPADKGSGNRQIRVLLPPVDDTSVIKGLLNTKAIFQVSEVKAGPFGSKEETAQSADTVAVVERKPQAPARVFLVSSQPLLSNSDVESSSASRDPNGPDWIASIRLKPAAAERLGAYTESHSGKSVAILLDDLALSVPTIMGKVESPLVVSGMKELEAKGLVLMLTLGPQPASVTFLQERTLR